MNSTFEWLPGQTLRRKRDGMIYQVAYKVICRQGDLKTSCNKVIRFVETDNPTPFESVTASQVVEWIKAKLGPDKVAEIEEFLKNEIAAKENRATLTSTFEGEN
tara:strand:+ start:1101 stop:1412 length:312 start_codon:yes stop_codon:yes gene_type:complete